MSLKRRDFLFTIADTGSAVAVMLRYGDNSSPPTVTAIVSGRLGEVKSLIGNSYRPNPYSVFTFNPSVLPDCDCAEFYLETMVVLREISF